MLDLMRHCMPHLAESLRSKSIISKDAYDKARCLAINPGECVAHLLDCIEAKLKKTPSDFIEVVHVLESEQYLTTLADNLVQAYSEHFPSLHSWCIYGIIF